MSNVYGCTGIGATSPNAKLDITGGHIGPILEHPESRLEMFVLDSEGTESEVDHIMSFANAERKLELTSGELKIEIIGNVGIGA